MSNLRFIGILIGIIGLVMTFIKYRGPKWHKSNFILISLFNLSLIIVSLDPHSVNFLLKIFSLEQAVLGRIISLMITAIIFLLFFTFYTKSKIEHMRLNFDKLIRKLGATNFEVDGDPEDVMKPIMIIIPAYNEADNLREMLPKIPKQIDGIETGVIVIDDGSSDETAQTVRALGFPVVSNVINRGQGAANRLGYDILKKYNVKTGVTMDADNQHLPEDLEKLIIPVINGEKDLVIGSRILGSHKGSSKFRNIGIRIFSKIIKIITSVNITDCSNGFKAFNIDKFQCLNLTEDQFQSAEVLIEAIKKGLNVGEVPITVDERKFGESKKGTDWSYGVFFAKTILKTWWR